MKNTNNKLVIIVSIVIVFSILLIIALLTAKFLLNNNKKNNLINKDKKEEGKKREGILKKPKLSKSIFDTINDQLSYIYININGKKKNLKDLNEEIFGLQNFQENINPQLEIINKILKNNNIPEIKMENFRDLIMERLFSHINRDDKEKRSILERVDLIRENKLNQKEKEDLFKEIGYLYRAYISKDKKIDIIISIDILDQYLACQYQPKIPTQELGTIFIEEHDNKINNIKRSIGSELYKFERSNKKENNINKIGRISVENPNNEIKKNKIEKVVFNSELNQTH